MRKALLLTGVLLVLAVPAAQAQVLNTQMSTANGTIWSIVRDGNTIYIGGEFTQLQPPVGPAVTRHFLAALDATTGAPTSWAPEPNNYVRALAVSNGVVYAGGLFTSVGGQTRNRIAALDPSTGAATSWDPNANNTVYTLALGGSTTYCGGLFTSIGGQSRNRIAALDVASGAATAWDPSASSSVRVLMPIGNTVYVGGHFLQIGGQSRNYLAALDATTGAATAWDPSPSLDVTALAVSGNTIYAGGGFYRIGGHLHDLVGAVDATTGVAIDWDPHLIPSISNIGGVLVSGNKVFIGGHFSTGDPENGPLAFEFAEVDATTGQVSAWDPGFCMYCNIRAMAISGNTLYIGGEFAEPRARLAAFDLDTPVPALVSLVSAEGFPDRTEIAWQLGGSTAGRITIQRRETDSPWLDVGAAVADGAGRIALTDRDVIAGTRYGYRLGLVENGLGMFLGETWVDVPRTNQLALVGVRPNPSTKDLAVAFSLPDGAAARLEVFDLAGRLVVAQEVGALGVGSHVVRIGEGRSLAAGVYAIRLTRGNRAVTTRAVIVR